MTASASAPNSPLSKLFGRTQTSARGPDPCSRPMVSLTAARAAALSAAGTESSRSRMMASVPAAIAFSAQEGLCPGTKSIDRYGFTRCLLASKHRCQVVPNE